MTALRTQVKNGRIFVDEPTTLPDGTIVEILPKRLAPEEKLSWEEIKHLYPNEWVILIELSFTEPSSPSISKSVCGGVVFAHSKKRDELLRDTAEALVGKERAFFFTGQMKGGLLRWGK